MLKSLIVEDNISFALELEILLKKIGYEVLKTVDNAGDALIEIISSKPDIIFMDIDIKGQLSGLDLAKKISHLNIPILFITSFADEKHFEIGSKIPNSTYLTKPVDEFTIRSSVDLLTKINYSLTNTNKSTADYKLEANILYLRKNEIFYPIRIEDIKYIESSNVYCRTVTNSDAEFMNRISLNKYISILNNADFIRPNRSYIININFITEVNLNENYIKLGDFDVSLSRNSKKEFGSLFHLIS